MSSKFKNIEKINRDGRDLSINPMPLWAFGETEIPIAMSFQIENSRAVISLEDFCDMFQIYLVRGGLGGWESLPCGIPEPVKKVLEAAAERIGR